MSRCPLRFERRLPAAPPLPWSARARWARPRSLEPFSRSDSPQWFDLEDPQVEAQLVEPLAALARSPRIGRHRRDPACAGSVQGLAGPDRSTRPAGSIPASGSASPALLRQSSESLAGRIEVIEIGGFTLDETGFASAPTPVAARWLPPFLTAPMMPAAPSGDASSSARTVERDLPHLGVNVAAPALYRFWSMLAHYHGQAWNAAEPAVRWASTRAPCAATSTC